MFNRDNNRGGFAPREMVQGNWICGKGDPENRGCGKTITELPFSPRVNADGSESVVFCKDCFRKIRDERGPRTNRY